MRVFSLSLFLHIVTSSARSLRTGDRSFSGTVSSKIRTSEVVREREREDDAKVGKNWLEEANRRVSES